MIDLITFYGVRLPGGFIISAVHLTQEPLEDALGREAVAQTIVRGREFHITIRHGLDDRELSISLYHEVLEAATVAALSPPESVLDFNEGDFERVAHEIYASLGNATATTLSSMLQSFGFRG